PGARLWGRTSIGVRCVEGASWSLAVPMTVAVFGPALVASRPISPNTPLAAADFHLQEVELSRENRPALTDPVQLEGSMSTRALRPGQTLRANNLRLMPPLGPAAPVGFRLTAPGFILPRTGRAWRSAGTGRPAEDRPGLHRARGRRGDGVGRQRPAGAGPYARGQDHDRDGQRPDRGCAAMRETMPRPGRLAALTAKVRPTQADSWPKTRISSKGGLQ